MNPAIAAGESGMSLVLGHQGADWQARATMFLLDYLRHSPGTMDEARQHAEELGLDAPTHHNAWGALTRTLHKQGLITRTGEWRQSSRIESHARMAPVWKAA